MSKKLKILQYVAFGITALFTVLHIHFAADVSPLAFIVGLLFSAAMFYFCIFKFDFKGDVGKFPIVKKIYEYGAAVLMAVFVLRRAGKSYAPYALDVVCAVLWFAFVVVAIVIQVMLGEKCFAKNSPEYSKQLMSAKKEKSVGKKIGREIYEWVEAFIYAAVTLTLINLFVFQLYEIPSESMVSEFLVKDRVIGMKMLSGPKFPLSEAGLPRVRDYNRGDIVIFRNPHYPKDNKSEVKTFLSTLVNIITFTKVNINVDEYGVPKADPLVKRVTGLPGEQLMMQDGVLYARTKNDNEFKPVTQDAKWAEYNLDALPQNIKRNVQDIIITDAQFKNLVQVEKDRSALSLVDVANEMKEIASQFEKLVGKNTGDYDKAVFSEKDLNTYSLFTESDKFTEKLISSKGCAKWFSDFMCDWTKNIPQDGKLVGGNIYDDANFRLNVMVKRNIGKLIVCNAELILEKATDEKNAIDEKRFEILGESENLFLCVYLLDRRNMPIFPANDKDGNAVYIPKNNYFLMGDNRFNSLDMRHSYSQRLVPISQYDDFSTTYYTNMSPQYVPAVDIKGTAPLRFWPLSRFGVPSKGKK